MGLGDLSDELAIVGAEFMKSCTSITGTHLNYAKPAVGYTTFDASEPGQVGFAPSVNNRKY